MPAAVTRRDLALVAAAVAIVGLIGAWPFGAPLETSDSAAFVLAGKAWLHGQVPYRDFYLFKPPVLLLLDALFGRAGVFIGLNEVAGVRLMGVAAATISAVSIACLAAAFGARRAAALTTGLLAGLLLSAHLFVFDGGLSEPPALALGLAAWSLARCSQSRWRWLGAGILGAAALGTSPLMSPLLAALAVTALANAWRRRALDVRQLFASAALGLAGALLVMLPLLAYFALNGALGALVEDVFDYNRVYAAYVCPPAGQPAIWLCGEMSRSAALYVPILVIPAIVALLGLRRGWLNLDLMAMLAAALVVLGPVVARNPVNHYLLPLVIPLLPLVALGLDALAERLARIRPGALALPAVLLLGFSLFIPVVASEAIFRVTRAAPGAPFHVVDERLAALIEQTDPSRPLVNWGASPTVYLLTGRQPIDSFHTFALRLPGYTSAAMVRGFCEGLARRLPVIVASTTTAPGILSTNPYPADFERAWFEPTWRLVESDWQPVGAIDGYVVLEPKEGVTPDPAECAPAP